jgi:hypothetical protein
MFAPLYALSFGRLKKYPLPRFTGSVPGVDHTVERQDLRLEHPQLGAESDETSAGNLRQPFVTCVGDHIEQLFNSIASDRGDNAKHAVLNRANFSLATNDRLWRPSASLAHCLRRSVASSIPSTSNLPVLWPHGGPNPEIP